MGGTESENALSGPTNNDDINNLLMLMKTASESGVDASERWVSRPKKRGNKKHTNVGIFNSIAEKKLRRDPAAPEVPPSGSVDSDAETAFAARRSSLDGGKTMPYPREVMVNRIVEYVMTRELGGRHNAAQCDREGFVPSRAALIAEMASMRPVAAYQVYHSVHGVTSVSFHEKAPEAIVHYRSGLYCCCRNRDLVGGYTSGRPLHTREHLRTLVRLGLKGERMDEMKRLHNDSYGSSEGCEAVAKGEGHSSLFGGTVCKPASSFLHDSSSSDSENA